MPMGRQKGYTEYKKEYLNKIDEYLTKRRDRKSRVITQARKGEKPYEIYSYGLKVKLPTVEGFANYIQVSRKSLYNWADKFPEFKKGLEKIKIEQLQRLIDQGLSGNYNSTIAKLILSSNHGYKERVDATTDDETLNQFSDEQIDKIAKRIAKRSGGASNSSIKKESN